MKWLWFTFISSEDSSGWES